MPSLVGSEMCIRDRSGVDINTQQSFEALSERAVAVVVDPIQSVKGKVVIGKQININTAVQRHVFCCNRSPSTMI